MATYRKIYEQHYGAKIPKGYHIHHKDMNHTNDDPLNLEALSPDEHAQKHGFLNNFIMAQAMASAKGAVTRKTPEFSAKMSRIMKGKLKVSLKAIAQRTRLHEQKVGVPHSPEHSLAISNAVRLSARAIAQRNIEHERRRGKPQPKIGCPHCGQSGGHMIMKRWHFSNCKRKV